MQNPPSPPDHTPNTATDHSSKNQPSNNQMDSHWTILKILQWTTTFFKSHAIDSPRLTAEILLAHILGIDRIDLYLRFDQPLTGKELSEFREAIKRRIRREPVAYITGTREFWGMDFTVTRDVLIPRPETEFLVEESLKLIPKAPFSDPFRVFDLGTGSGAVVVALAAHRPGNFYVASDISPQSIAIATKNASRHRLINDICFFVGKLFMPLDANALKFDLIVSNPPYIASDQMASLAPEVVCYEPCQALDGGADGFDMISKIIRDAPRYMKKNATLLLEIGYDQKNGLREMVARDGRYTDLEFIRDYGGHDRVAKMQLK